MKSLKLSATMGTLLALTLGASSCGNTPARAAAPPSGKTRLALQGAAVAKPIHQILDAWHVGQSETVGLPAQGVHLDNRARSAGSWWARASSRLSIQAVDVRGEIGAAAPGQTLVLDAVWTKPSRAALRHHSQPRWRVDSPDGSLASVDRGAPIVTGSALPRGTVLSRWETFRAAKPGVYVIQALWGSQASVPLVVTIGANQLRAMPHVPKMPPQVAGVESLPTAALSLDATDRQAVSAGDSTRPRLMRQVWVGRPVGGWLPLAGQVPTGWMRPGWSRSVTITLFNLITGTTVNYLLPVNHAGDFSGIVASPYRGRVMVQLSPSNDTALARDVPSANSATETATWGTTVTVNAAVPLRPALAALASVDYQMAGFRGAVAQAARLWYNAPDPETGAIAIANWVATHIAYNYQEDRQISGSKDRWYVGATVDQTWSARTGVCENYAQVLAAMLRSLGIRCILEDGQASTGYVSSWTLELVYTLRTTGKNHAWVEVEGVAPHAVATDPTWNGGSPPSLSAARVLTSSYTTDTQLFNKTHHPAGVEMSGAVFP